MSQIENDEPFIRRVESLINPAEVSDLIFFSSLKKFIPPSLFKRVLYNTSKRYPRIGFVIEPYCLFLFFRLRDVEKARRLLPQRYELAKARVFDGDPPEFYFGMGIFNTRASTFWGSRLETYLIATDRVTGITSWIFADILSDTIIAHPGTGIADPNCARAMYTTNSRGEVFLDFQQAKQDRGLELRGNLTRGTRRPLEQDLWIMGNASIGHVESFGGGSDEPFAVVFDPAEVASALDIPVADLRITRNTILPDFAEPALRKAVCFPFAQHYIADSPGRRTFVKDPGDMVVKYNEIASMDPLETFSAKSLKTLFLAGALASGVASVVLLAVLLLGR
jgi:hypothetical protein